ncbi:hypothetical protein B0H13DRAFT_2354028 [Mycena leptocephala]|nr:hypothetical protein B0H13DRAFT_2354028 [Mycena leptocephala]
MADNVRCSPGAVPITQGIDKIFSTRLRAGLPSLIPSSRYKDMESHVLIAAHRPDEHARESDMGGVVRGDFTYQLMKFLQDSPSLQITYSDVIIRLPNHLTRLLSAREHFKIASCSLGLPLMSLLFTWELGDGPEPLTFSVGVGSLRGVAIGSKFTMDPSSSLPQKFLVATEVDINSSIPGPVCVRRHLYVRD